MWRIANAESFHCFQSIFIASLSFDPHNYPERWAGETVMFLFWQIKRPLQASAASEGLWAMFSSVTARWTLLLEQPGEKQKPKTLSAWCTSGVPDALSSFPRYNVHHHLHMFLVVRVSFSPSPFESTRQREYDTCSHSQHSLFPFPALFFSSHLLVLDILHSLLVHTTYLLSGLPTGM